MTAFEDAFERAGFGRDAITFLTAYARLLNNGGSRQQANDLLDYADRQSLSGRGHIYRAQEGHLQPSPSRQPNSEAGGHIAGAQQGHILCAPASLPNGDGEGHTRLANKGQFTSAPSSPQNGGGGDHAANAEKGQGSFVSSPSRGAGHSPLAGKASGDVPAGGGAGHSVSAQRAIQTAPAPRPMSESRRNAMMQVGKQRARSFWDEEIGGIKRRVGSLTKFDIIQIKRRSLIDGHIADRLLTEIDWPDQDTTTLEKIGQQSHVKEIIGSAAKALEALHA